MAHQGVDAASMQHPNGAQTNYQAAFTDLFTRGGNVQPFAIVKLTEVGKRADGTTWVYDNPFAQQDIAGYKAAGFAVAGYHFMHGNTTAQEQIAAILAHLDSVDFVWLDCEVSDGATAQAYDALLSAIVAGVGMRVGIYDNLSFSAFIAQGGFAESLPLWLADPSNSAPTRPRAITQIGQGNVAGIVGQVDLDVCEDSSFKVLWPSVSTVAPTPTPTVVVDPVNPAQPVIDAAPPAVTPEPVVTPEPTPVVAPTPVEPTPVTVPQKGVNEMLPVINDTSTDTESIKRIQGLLVANGHNLGTTGSRGDGIDGGFGPVTLREVLLFQHQSGITADGIVGAITWGKLLGI